MARDQQPNTPGLNTQGCAAACGEGQGGAARPWGQPGGLGEVQRPWVAAAHTQPCPGWAGPLLPTAWRTPSRSYGSQTFLKSLPGALLKLAEGLSEPPALKLSAQKRFVEASISLCVIALQNLSKSNREGTSVSDKTLEGLLWHANADHKG